MLRALLRPAAAAVLIAAMTTVLAGCAADTGRMAAGDKTEYERRGGPYMGPL